MMKAFLAAALLAPSSYAFAKCRVGQMTSITQAIQFSRKESSGNILTITMGAGAPVHIIGITDGKVELLAHAEFQGQTISLLADVDTGAGKILACAE